MKAHVLQVLSGSELSWLQKVIPDACEISFLFRMYRLRNLRSMLLLHPLAAWDWEHRRTHSLDLSDLWGPLPVPSSEGIEVFLTPGICLLEARRLRMV